MFPNLPNVILTPIPKLLTTVGYISDVYVIKILANNDIPNLTSYLNNKQIIKNIFTNAKKLKNIFGNNFYLYHSNLLEF